MKKTEVQEILENIKNTTWNCRSHNERELPKGYYADKNDFQEFNKKINQKSVKKCSYCKCVLKFQKKKITHINIFQNPKIRYFCSENHQNSWIYLKQEYPNLTEEKFDKILRKRVKKEMNEIDY